MYNFLFKFHSQSNINSYLLDNNIIVSLLRLVLQHLQLSVAHFPLGDTQILQLRQILHNPLCSSVGNIEIIGGGETELVEAEEGVEGDESLEIIIIEIVGVVHVDRDGLEILGGGVQEELENLLGVMEYIIIQ